MSTQQALLERIEGIKAEMAAKQAMLDALCKERIRLQEAVEAGQELFYCVHREGFVDGTIALAIRKGGGVRRLLRDGVSVDTGIAIGDVERMVRGGALLCVSREYVAQSYVKG